MDRLTIVLMVMLSLMILIALPAHSNNKQVAGLGKTCIAEALECICEDFYYKYRYKYVETESAWAEAYVEGYICSPSDGNVHAPSGYGTGGPILIDNGFDYIERGCNGDLIRAWAIARGVDGSRVSAYASLGAPPCCAT